MKNTYKRSKSWKIFNSISHYKNSENSKRLLWTSNVVSQVTKLLFVFKDNSSCEKGTPFLKAMLPTFHLFLLLLEILRDMPKIYLQACSLHFYYFLYLKYFNILIISQTPKIVTAKLEIP